MTLLVHVPTTPTPPSEQTPLVGGYNHPDDKPQNEIRIGVVPIVVVVSLVVMTALLGAFSLGIVIGGRSTTSWLSILRSDPPRSSSSSWVRHYETDDFVRLDDDDDDPADSRLRRTNYVGTQFISFTINTRGGLAEEGECEGRSVAPNGKCYLGNANNITEDLLHRLAIVEDVLRKLKADAFQQKPDIDHNDDVLKIVILPEFFWRGPYGAYSTKQLIQDDGVLVQVANVIQDVISDNFFNDFLFVFGTVVAARSPDDPREPWEHALSAEEVEYFNFASVVKGGIHGKHYAVTKRYISGADFLSRTSLPNPKDADLHDYSQMNAELQAAFEKRNVILIRDNVVELDGLRIGVEICLDHRLGVLWNDLKTKHHGELVDVLLITSAGMSIEHGPNPVVPGGVVYLSDGSASSAACMRTDDYDVFLPDHVCRGDIGGVKHIPIGGPG